MEFFFYFFVFFLGAIFVEKWLQEVLRSTMVLNLLLFDFYCYFVDHDLICFTRGSFWQIFRFYFFNEFVGAKSVEKWLQEACVISHGEALPGGERGVPEGGGEGKEEA